MSNTCCTTQKLNVIVIGMPGSGKGTQSQNIAKRYGLKHITSGELLRQEAETGSEDAAKIKELMKTGTLFPSELVEKILLKNVPECNFVLDGYPRKMTQVETFKDIDLVLFIRLSEEQAMERLMHREQNRVDDNKKTIKTRLAVFEEETLPVVEYFKDKGLLEEVDGAGTVDEVFSRIGEVIFKRFNI